LPELDEYRSTGVHVAMQELFGDRQDVFEIYHVSQTATLIRSRNRFIPARTRCDPPEQARWLQTSRPLSDMTSTLVRRNFARIFGKVFRSSREPHCRMRHDAFQDLRCH
jgi:hypothetical protein